MKTVTIKTIAKEFGVTPATVSKALRDSSDIAEATKVKIKELANDMGYQPNYLARSLVNKSSNIIGIIMPDISTSFFGFTIRGINEAARVKDFETIILVNDENYDVERKNLEFLSKMQVDGIIIDSVPGEHNVDLIKNLSKRGIPFVFVDRKCELINSDSVTTDDLKASYSITNYFIENNRKKIAFVGAIDYLTVAKDRMMGYKKALEESDIEFDKDMIIPIHYEIKKEDLKNRVREFINTGKEFDAFVCAGGLIAYLVGVVLLEEGYQISEDVSLGEFGDNNIVHRLGVPFVTVDQSPYDIGQRALELLVERINSKEVDIAPKHILMDSRLIYHNPAAQKHIFIKKI